MKNLLFIFSLLTIFSLTSFSQTMEVKNGKLYYGDLKISLSKAKELATTKNNSDALEAFSKAAKMKRWNLVWAVIGGADVGYGFGDLISGKPGAFLWKELVGGALIYYVVKREKQANVYLLKGVNTFNGQNK